MRKILFLLTTLLSGSLAFAQEAETASGNELEVRVIPRFEVNPYAPTNGGDWDFDFGVSSLYTQIEGSLGDHVSYFFSNHWLSTDTASLYVIDEEGKSANLFRNDFTNWLDMGYVNLNFGSWDFTLGKDMVVIGSYEEDAYDYDSHANLNSYFWNAAQVYQWGAKVAWTTPDESSQFLLQLMSSPFSCRPFGNSWLDENDEGHLKTISAGWYGDFDWFAPIWSVNMMEYAKGQYLKMVGLGNQFYAGDFTLTLDWISRITDFSEKSGRGMTLNASALYNLNDKWEFFVKGGIDTPADDHFELYDQYSFFGAGVHYYPLRDSQDLRIHAVAAYNNFAESISLNLGVTYNFSLSALLKK